MSDKPCSSQRDVLGYLEQLLDALVSDEVPHSRSMIGTDDYTTIEGDAYGAGSSLDDVRFGIHVIDRTESSLRRQLESGPLSIRRGAMEPTLLNSTYSAGLGFSETRETLMICILIHNVDRIAQRARDSGCEHGQGVAPRAEVD